MLLLRKDDGVVMKTRDVFYRYLPHLGDYVYDVGEVAKILNDGAEVDFGDTLVRFGTIEIIRVINMRMGEYQFTSITMGETIADYRCYPSPILGHDSVLADFEGILNSL